MSVHYSHLTLAATVAATLSQVVATGCDFCWDKSCAVCRSEHTKDPKVQAEARLLTAFMSCSRAERRAGEHYEVSPETFNAKDVMASSVRYLYALTDAEKEEVVLSKEITDHGIPRAYKEAISTVKEAIAYWRSF